MNGMDFLVELGENQAAEEKLQWLKKRKQNLKNKLEILKNEMFDVEVEKQTKQEKAVQKLADILQAYRLLGVSVESSDPVLVLRFDPLYRNQYPATEYYSVQLKPNEDKLVLGSHNLPLFVPAKRLSDTHLPTDIPEFVRNIQRYLYAYVQRREGVKHAKESFQKYILNDPEVDLAVTYVRLQLSLGQQIPDMDLSLTYDLLKCVPDSVHIKPCEENATQMSQKRWDQTVKDFKSILLSCDLHTALTEIWLKDS